MLCKNYMIYVKELLIQNTIHTFFYLWICKISLLSKSKKSQEAKA